VGGGLVASLAGRGGNVTGLTATAGPEIYGKQLQLLKTAFPRISRVAVLVRRADPTYARAMPEIETAIRALGLQQHLAVVRDSGDFEGAFANLTAARPDAMFVPIDSLFYQHRARLTELVAKTRLPAMWGAREFAEA